MLISNSKIFEIVMFDFNFNTNPKKKFTSKFTSILVTKLSMILNSSSSVALSSLT